MTLTSLFTALSIRAFLMTCLLCGTGIHGRLDDSEPGFAARKRTGTRRVAPARLWRLTSPSRHAVLSSPGRATHEYDVDAPLMHTWGVLRN